MGQAVWERIAGFVLLCIVIVVLITTLFITPDFNTTTYAILRFLAATAAGFCAAFFSGRFNLEANLPVTKVQVRATSAFAMFLAVFFLFYLNLPTDQSSQDSFSSRAQIAKADVIVAQFDQKASRPVEIGRRIESSLERNLRQADLRDVSVEFSPDVIESEIEAEQIAGKNTAAVIWGWYDDYEIRVRIFLPSYKTVQEFNEIPFDIGDDLSNQIGLVVRESLPRNVSFLTFLIAGQIEYAKNNYVEGYQFFDLAMSDIPDNVRIENEEMVPFLVARQIQSSGRLPAWRELVAQDEAEKNAEQKEKLVTAICGYASAIQTKPSFAEAYNNLGVLLSVYSSSEGDSLLLEDESTTSCLKDIVPEVKYQPLATDMLKKAIELKQDWVLPEYNLLTYYYNQTFYYNRSYYRERDSKSLEEYKQDLKRILKSDGSLYGAYIMLASIELELEDTEAAKDALMEALSIAQSLDSLSPDVLSKLHVNLGQAYLKSEKYDEAKFEFNKAIQIDADNSEALLALAHVAMLTGNADESLGTIQAMSDIESKEREQPSSPLYSAKILESLLYFDEGKYGLAISTLESLKLERDSRSKYISYIALPNYLIGLLYDLQGEKSTSVSYLDRAKDSFEGAEYSGGYNHKDNSTTLLTWTTVRSECLDLFGEKEAPSEICSLENIEEHTSYVYSLFSDRLTDRIFYRGGLLIIGG